MVSEEGSNLTNDDENVMKFSKTPSYIKSLQLKAAIDFSKNKKSQRNFGHWPN